MVGARHRVSLEIAFRRQKAAAKLLNDAFYAYLMLLNQDVALVRPGAGLGIDAPQVSYIM